MAPKEPTRAQLSNKLSYQSQTPAFLLKLQNRINGKPDYDDEENEGYDNDEFEYVGNGRAPIPRRPPIPQRPKDDDRASADEDDDFEDERPQVVVLKEGKHLTAREAENIRRKEKGLPPLPDDTPIDENEEESSSKAGESSTSKSASTSKSLSFSSSKGTSAFGKSNKRKAIGQLDELKAELAEKAEEVKGKEGKQKDKDKKKGSSKKPKKESKTLLSFGDEA
ncbi:hypothetical protein CVT24_000730 [Panaeolus cyanescens]|uniref:DUF4604 domain-containing protein n=1 Tax=Panaeolus cyanescens TaxID=181874 RepID=A0A409WSI5_9AGAR|nr:hypothetical protein CVT24_000730 [Panaeolus cyanescens]